MKDLNPTDHWQNVYLTKQVADLSWHQPTPQLSLDLIRQFKPELSSRIIDVGAGNSNLVNQLFEAGYHHLAILDISAEAIATSSERLAQKGGTTECFIGDILTLPLPVGFDLWHDRALFHFLTSPADQDRYVQVAARSIAPAGILILMTFAKGGPTSCSGLEVAQHDSDSICQLFGSRFELLSSENTEHRTPWGASQSFFVAVLRRF